MLVICVVMKNFKNRNRQVCSRGLEKRDTRQLTLHRLLFEYKSKKRSTKFSAKYINHVKLNYTKRNDESAMHLYCIAEYNNPCGHPLLCTQRHYRPPEGSVSK